MFDDEEDDFDDADEFDFDGFYCELVERGRGFDSEGRLVRRFTTGELEISVLGDRIKFYRKGGLYEGLELTRQQLPALLRALERWRELRDGWAEFVEGGHFGVPGMSMGRRAWRYAPPHEAEKRIGIAAQTWPDRELRVEEGRVFTVEWEERAVEPPEEVAPGLELTHRLWGTAAGLTPPEGHQTGEILRLAGGYTVRADRSDLIVEAGEQGLELRTGDEGPLAALAKVLSAEEANSA